jgi:microcystin degradation protein MlrC
VRIGVGGIYHETHTFVPEPTRDEHFTVVHGPELLDRHRGTGTALGGALEALEGAGHTALPLAFAEATPSGPIDDRVWQGLAQAVLEAARAATALDGVVLALHGAAVTTQRLAPEAELCRALRAALPGVPLGVGVDFHANLGPPWQDAVDFLAGYDTYPHLDIAERTAEVARAVVAMAEGRLRTAQAVANPPLLAVPQAMATDREPFASLLALAHQAEAQPGVVSVTVAGGFPYADVPWAGCSVWAVTEGDRDLAQQVADAIARSAFARRKALRVANPGVEEAVAQALAAPQGPVVLVDVADNVGGGTPADGTAILAELVRRAAPSALVTLWDPEAAAACHAAGVGGEVAMAVGGKSHPLMGPPVPVRGRVVRLHPGPFVHQGPYRPGLRADMGPTAVLEAGGITLVLTSRRQPPWDVGYLAALDLDPRAFHVIVAKAAVAWQAAFGPVCRQAITVDAPGLTPVDLRRLPYRHLRRPIFPLDPMVAWTP